MDFNKLIPDFSAFGKTEWNKPCLDTQDKLHLGGLVCAALLVIFVFIPWFSADGPGSADASRLGISLWYGIIAFLGALIGVYGMLYKNYQFAFWGAAIVLLMAIIGLFVVPSVEVGGVEFTSSEVKKMIKPSSVSVSRIGAILALIASLCLGACSYLKINNK